MIKVKLQGRIGNQLFQYAFALIASRKLNSFFIFTLTNKWGFDLKYFELSFPHKLIKFRFFYRIYNFVQNKIVFKNVIFEEKNLLNWAYEPVINDTNYIGYFQSSSLYEENKTLLTKVFKIKKKYRNSFSNKYKSILKKETIVLSCRFAEDYAKFKFPINHKYNVSLPFNWYIKVLEHLNAKGKSILVIADDLEKARMILEPYEFDFIFIDDTVINQFQLLLNANTCIITNSSFAWWAAFLNNNKRKKIYAPKNWGGFNAGIEYPPNIMTKDFIWVE